MKKVNILGESEFLKASIKPDLTSKVVMHATETCYGLAVDVFDEKALNKLYKIKKMPATKPVSMMVRDLQEAEKYADFDDLARGLAVKFWPGPLTLVLPRKRMAGTPAEEGLPDFFNPESETVGIRCPDSEISRALIDLNKRPLTTTSANVSGRPEVYRVLDYLSQLEEYDVVPDLVIDGGEIERKKPSTIVKILDGKWEYLREGDLKEEVDKYLVQAMN